MIELLEVILEDFDQISAVAKLILGAISTILGFLFGTVFGISLGEKAHE